MSQQRVLVQFDAQAGFVRDIEISTALPWECPLEHAVVPFMVSALLELLSLTIQSLLLIPFWLAFLAKRRITSRRGVHFICPSAECGHRGWPAYVCPSCGQVNDKLWHNLYGPLWHYCIRCDHRLYVLNVLGRRDLQQSCAFCHTPLRVVETPDAVASHNEPSGATLRSWMVLFSKSLLNEWWCCQVS